MEIHTIDFRRIPDLGPSVACIGYFDGMHKGHQQLLDRCLKIAKKDRLSSVLITFDPDPWTVFYPEKQMKHIMLLQDKIHYAQKKGFDAFYILQFDREFANQNIDQFHALLHALNIQSLICGFDFRYACKNKGNVHTLQEQSYFHVSVVDSVNDQEIKISSSRIEPLILQGQLLTANHLLGYIYSIHGTIVRGFQRGTKILGIPTANLNVKEEYVLPVVGVYCGLVSVRGSMYGAMINIGNNPTFENKFQTIEANIFHFNEDIYGEEARFFFFDKIRDEKKFSSAKELKDQLLQDIETSKKQIEMNSDMIRNTAELWENQLFIE